MNKPRNCGNCEFYQRSEDSLETSVERGECRRFPPTIEDIGLQGRWLKVKGKIHWCGEFQERIDNDT